LDSKEEFINEFKSQNETDQQNIMKKRSKIQKLKKQLENYQRESEISKNKILEAQKQLQERVSVDEKGSTFFALSNNLKKYRTNKTS